MVHHDVHLILFQLEHLVEGVQEFVKLFRLTLLFFLHVIDLVLRPTNHAGADEELQQEDEDEGEAVPGEGQLLRPVIIFFFLLIITTQLSLFIIDLKFILLLFLHQICFQRKTSHGIGITLTLETVLDA